MTAVYATSERMVWNGKAFPVSGVTWSQSFSGGMPSAVAHSTGNSFWKASVTVADNQFPVNTGSPSPANGSYPVAGDTVFLYVVVDGKETVYAPIVDTVSFSQGGVNIDLITPVESLANAVRLAPQMQVNPQTLNPWGAERYGHRPTAISLYWVVSEALKKAGYYSTPPAGGTNLLDITMQGGVVTNTWNPNMSGQVIKSGSLSGAPSPNYVTYQNTIYMNDLDLIASGSTGHDMTGRFFISFMALPASQWNGTLSFMFAEGYANQSFVIRIDAARNLSLVVIRSGNETQLATVAAAEWANDVHVTLLVRDNRFTLKTESATRTNTVAWALNWTGVFIKVSQGAGIAAVQVKDPGTTGGDPSTSILAFQKTALIGHEPWTHFMLSSPGIRDKSVKAVLDEIAEATCSAWWIDGLGVAHWESARALRSKAVKYQLESLYDIADYTFTSDMQQKWSTVEITYSEVSREFGNTWTRTVFEGGSTANAGDLIETFIEPEEGQDFIDVATVMNNVGENPGGFNARNGTWYGAAVDGPGNDDPTQAASGYTAKLAQVTPWAFKLTETTTQDCNREAFDSPLIKKALRGAPLPVVRARGIVNRTDATTTVSTGLAGKYGVFKHDATPWIDLPEYAVQMANFLADTIKTPGPYLDNLTVIYSPQIVVGDVVRVLGIQRDGSNNLFGIIGVYLVEGFTHNADESTTDLTLRLIVEEYRAKTWAEAHAEADSRKLIWDTLHQENEANNVTWADVQADPSNHVGE